MINYTQPMPEFHNDSHHDQQQIIQQAFSQSGLDKNPDCTRILSISLEKMFGRSGSLLKNNFTNELLPSPRIIIDGEIEGFEDFMYKPDLAMAYCKSVIDSTLAETGIKISDEEYRSLVNILMTTSRSNSATVDALPISAAAEAIPIVVELPFNSPSVVELGEVRIVEFPTTYFPPEVEIKNISPKEFSTIQKEFIRDLIYDFGSDDRLITDRLPLSVVSVGNARIIDLEDFSNLCITSFGEKYRETSNNEWMQLRKSTCPYSVLSDYERELIQDNIKKIVAYATAAGLLIVVVYLVVEVEKIKRKKLQSINTDGGDIVLENGYLDKREGTFFYVNISNNGEQDGEEAKNAHIQIERPFGKFFKPITIVLDPENENKFFAFPNLLNYVADNAVDIENAEFGVDKLNDCRAASFLPYNENQIVAEKKLIGLLDNKNEEVRSISADALGEIKAESVIQGLGEHLKKEKSEKVINNILLSLLSIGTDAAILYVFEYIANHNISELLTNWCIQKANSQSLLVLFQTAIECPLPISAQNILSKIKHQNISLEPILNEFSSSTIDNIKLNIASFLILILEKTFDNDVHKKISSALAISMIEDKKDIATEISQKMEGVNNLSPVDIDALLKSLDSPYDEVRINIVKKLGDTLKK